MENESRFEKMKENCKIVRTFLDDLIKNLETMRDETGELHLKSSYASLLIRNLKVIRGVNSGVYQTWGNEKIDLLKKCLIEEWGKD